MDLRLLNPLEAVESDEGASSGQNERTALRRRRVDSDGVSDPEGWKRALSMMARKKSFKYEEIGELKRVLNLFDLTFLGIGSMLGMGVYIMVGDLANRVGPGMVLSFAIAGIACAISAVCYAEFAGRTPCTGSAYAYSYITIGEFVAFLIGWNLLLEFVIGTACLARGMSGYVDSLTNNVIADYLNSTMHMSNSHFASYPDWFAFSLMILFTAIVCTGVKESTTLNNIFVVINMVTIVCLIVVGLINANLSNWTVQKDENYPLRGEGGFFPFGFSRVMEGAATCFYAYSGFDTVATTGSEAKSPQKTIPMALMMSIFTALFVYSSTSLTFTLMWPFYDPELSSGYPYPYVLDGLGWHWIKYLVTVGACAAVFGCLLSSTFGMARIVYAIAEDGLIFKSLSKVNRRTRTPVRAASAAGLLTGILAVIFDTDQLIDMTSLGTLMAYTMVAICVLILRYENNPAESNPKLEIDAQIVKKLLNLNNTTVPDVITRTIALTCILTFLVLSFLLGFVLAFAGDLLIDGQSFIVFLFCVLLLALIVTFIILSRQPQSPTVLLFKVKPVPFLPVICMIFNVYLMMKLGSTTWIRFIVWLAIGLVMYFGYGLWNSKEQVKTDKKREANL